MASPAGMIKAHIRSKPPAFPRFSITLIPKKYQNTCAARWTLLLVNRPSVICTIHDIHTSYQIGDERSATAANAQPLRRTASWAFQYIWTLLLQAVRLWTIKCGKPCSHCHCESITECRVAVMS